MKVLVFVAASLASTMLYGCGSGGGSTPAPTPTPPPTAPTPPPTSPPTPQPAPPPPTPLCKDVGCCKQNSKGGQDQLCEDFYNPENGIAFTMLNTSTWELYNGGFPSLDQDHAVFNKNPPSTFLENGQQAMSLTHFQKGAEPYTGYQNSYGVAFPMGKPSTFWKFFQKDKRAPNELCGRCTDGAVCAAVYRQPLGDMSWEEFQKQKNAIMDMTGEESCGQSVPGHPHLPAWQYNEFDTNGLSIPDLAGVFYNIDESLPNDAPQFSDDTLCSFLYNKTATKKNWPFYVYKWNKHGESSLYLDRFLGCGATLVELV